MATRWFGAPVQRTEDPRLLRGKGNYVDDIDLPDMLHAAVLRSPHARARIVNIDSSAARELPGVHLVLTAGDLGEVLEPSPLLVPHHALTQPRTQLPLALNEVYYVGEAVAFVVADSRYIAEDSCAACHPRDFYYGTWSRHAYGVPGHPGTLGSSRKCTYLLDIDTRTYSHTQRTGCYFSPSRTQSAGDSSRCGWWLRPKNYALLS